MSNATVEIEIDGARCRVIAGISVASALINAGVVGFRSSVGGEPRAPLCGMGICYECRVEIDGCAHQRACLRSVEQGMRIVSGMPR